MCVCVCVCVRVSTFVLLCMHRRACVRAYVQTNTPLDDTEPVASPTSATHTQKE